MTQACTVQRMGVLPIVQVPLRSRTFYNYHLITDALLCRVYKLVLLSVFMYMKYLAIHTRVRYMAGQWADLVLLMLQLDAMDSWFRSNIKHTPNHGPS